MTATTATLTRYFGKCTEKGCKHRVVIETDQRPAGHGCIEHGAFWSLDWRPLAGTFNPAKECNGRCMGAVGPACDCSCGGENHGRTSI